MKQMFKAILLLLVGLVLNGCGGSSDDRQVQSPQAATAGTIVVRQAVSSSYTTVVQQLYIAYFGRPADSGGLANFSAQLAGTGAAADIQSLNAAYGASASVRALVDGFGASEESRALYPGDTAAFVTAIYSNVLGRAPDQEGLRYWVSAIDARVLTKANASFSIMAGALVNRSRQGLVDAQLINKRVAVGTNFTAALNTPELVSAYSGAAAAATARAMLASVTAAADVAAFQPTIATTIRALAEAASQNARAFASDVDKLVPRLCTDGCVQSSETMVVDTAGNATAVWLEPAEISEEGTTYVKVVSSRRTATSGSWSPPEVVVQASVGVKMYLTTASEGRVRLAYLYAYQAFGRTWETLGMAEFVPGSGWVYRGGFDTYYQFYGDLAFGSGRNGDLFVTASRRWESRFDTTTTRVFLRYLANGSGWQSDEGTHLPSFDKIVGDDSGGAIGIQYRNNALHAMRLDTATGQWTDLRTLDGSGYPITQLEGTADRDGNVMLIYERHNTANNTRSIRTHRFQKSDQSWTLKNMTPVSGSRVYGNTSIQGDRHGNFYAAWVQYSGAYMKTIAAHYSASRGAWSEPVVISRGSYHTRDAAVTSDDTGNAMFVWSQRTDTGTGSSTDKIFRGTAVRYSNWQWGTPKVFQDANRTGYKPFIGADSNGRTVVLWTQNSSIPGIKEIRSDWLVPN